MKTALAIFIALPCFGAVTVTWVSPTPGSIVTNPVALLVGVTNDAGEIGHVDFYRDGVLVDKAFGKLTAPVIDRIK